MANWTYETVTPTPIENVLVERGLADGVHRIYRVSAIEGYVLHDNSGNWTDIDGNECEAYYRGTVTCPASYDFTANPREFYAIPENEAPADQIFGDDNNDHEVM